jgi:hypothetical protein
MSPEAVEEAALRLEAMMQLGLNRALIAMLFRRPPGCRRW